MANFSSWLHLHTSGITHRIHCLELYAPCTHAALHILMQLLNGGPCANEQQICKKHQILHHYHHRHHNIIGGIKAECGLARHAILAVSQICAEQAVHNKMKGCQGMCPSNVTVRSAQPFPQCRSITISCQLMPSDAAYQVEAGSDLGRPVHRLSSTRSLSPSRRGRTLSNIAVAQTHIYRR